MATRFGSFASRLSSPLEMCDRCGVRAQMRIVLDSGGHLYLCGHHTNEHRDALERIAFALDRIHA